MVDLHTVVPWTPTRARVCVILHLPGPAAGGPAAVPCSERGPTGPGHQPGAAMTEPRSRTTSIALWTLVALAWLFSLAGLLSIGLHSRGIVGLHVGADGTLQAPTSFERVGWYTGGPTPGQLGPAVLGGHVDSKSGPAVFYRLGELHRGAEVTVTRRDGSVARFVIDRVGRFAKAAFPTREVYGNTTNRAEIRLITCGGAFDRATGHYVDNVVAFGHLSA